MAPRRHNLDNTHNDLYFCFVGITIGFEEEMYSAGESDGMVFVVATVLMGELATSVTVDFSTEPQTASSKAYIVSMGQVITFVI